MCAKANLSTAFLPDFVNKLQLKLQCGLIKSYTNFNQLGSTIICVGRGLVHHEKIV